jgi:transcription elongation GreA/GreB family factor
VSADKIELVARIRAHLERELETLAGAARAAYDAATNEQSRAENKYDTRALEASYLAGAQARRAGELKDMIVRYQRLHVRSFDNGDAIALSALVQLECDGEGAWYFLGPCAGGVKVAYRGHTVTVITPGSPMGRQIIDKEIGDVVTVKSPAGKRDFEVLALE